MDLPLSWTLSEWKSIKVPDVDRKHIKGNHEKIVYICEKYHV